MRADEFTVVVRNNALAARGVILPEDMDLTAALRHNNVGEWTLKLAADHPMAAELAATGGGIVVSVPGPSGTPEVLFSGSRSRPVTKVSAAELGAGVLEVTGTTDDVILGGPVTYPDPSNPDPSTQAAATDQRTGPVETLLHAYTDANMGPAAPVARRHPLLTMGVDGARGPSVTMSPRFKQLGAVLGELARLGNIGFKVTQDGAALRFDTFEPVDRSGTVRMSVYNGSLEGYEIEDSSPGVTHVLVLGQGEGAERQVVQRTTPALEAWALATGRRIEATVDRRDTDDVAVLEAAGDAYLAENGVTVPAVRVRPVGDSVQQLGREWNLGDTVAVIVGEQETVATVTEVGLTVNSEGVKVAAAIGDVTGYTAEARQAARITAVERDVEQLKTAGAADIAAALALAAPAGMIAPWGGLVEDVPEGWLPCDGAAVSRTEYAALFAAIGTTHGAGDGSTTFNVPNSDGRVLLGADDTYTEGSTGGSTNHRHGVPDHVHDLDSATAHAQIALSDDDDWIVARHDTSVPTWQADHRTQNGDLVVGNSTTQWGLGVNVAGDTNSGGPGYTYYGTDTSMQPYLAVPFMIKA